MRSKPASLGFTLLSLALISSSCGSSTTTLDERCADLAASGYSQEEQLKLLLEASHQPRNGGPEDWRHRAKAICSQLGSGGGIQP